MSDIRKLDDLMSERQVYEKYKDLFADRELREARQSGLLEFFDLRKGPYYSEEQLAAYLSTKATRKCRNEPLNDNGQSDQPAKRSGSSKLEGIGSQPRIAAPS
jgi:hypothetical protein